MNCGLRHFGNDEMQLPKSRIWRDFGLLKQSRFYHCQKSTAHRQRIKVDGSVATISIKNFPIGLIVMYLYFPDTPRNSCACLTLFYSSVSLYLIRCYFLSSTIHVFFSQCCKSGIDYPMTQPHQSSTYFLSLSMQVSLLQNVQTSSEAHPTSLFNVNEGSFQG
jgi:hypothetical protein